MDKFIFLLALDILVKKNAKILASFFGTIKEFTKLFDLKSREKLLINLKDSDGIGETQIISINNFLQI